MQNVKEVKLSPENELLFQRIFNSSRTSTISSSNVAALTVPTGWNVTCEKQNLPGGGRLSACRPAEHPDDVELSIYATGSHLDHESASAFQQVLARPPHSLLGTELASVHNVLRSIADDHAFKLLLAQTRALNGRTVLVVEGRNIKRHTDSVILYVVGTDGSVEEISYTAPSNLYMALLIRAKRAFDSIAWNQDQSYSNNN